MKLNTFDFVLIDPVPVPQIDDRVTCTDPVWVGNVAAVTTSDPTDRPGHVTVTVAATNSVAGYASAAPFNLTDTPDSSYGILLEDGSGLLLLEDSVSRLEQEAYAFGYQKLSVKTTKDNQGNLKTQGTCTVFHSGLWPAMTFLLTSSNQGYSAQNFSVTDVSVTWVSGPAGPRAIYVLTFGDPIVTMSVWANSQAQSAVLPIDSTKITDGAVTTPKLAAGSVTADKLTATLILATMIQAGAGPAHMEMDGNGLRAYDVNGNLVVNIPDDGSPVTVNAQILAQTLVATGNTVFNGALNELSLNAALQLDGSQTDPSQAPSITANWLGVALPINASYDNSASVYNRVGLDYDSNGGAGGIKTFWQATNKGSGTEYALELLASDRTVNRAFNLTQDGVGTPYSVCRLGGYVFVLSKDGSTGSPTSFGHTGGATFTFDFSGANTDNQLETSSLYSVPSNGTITSLSVYMGGHTAAVNTILVIWDSGGNVVGQSAQFSAAKGRALQTRNLIAPLVVTAGQQFRIGFWRAKANDAEWGVASSGSFRTKTANAVSSTSGDTACASPYACGDMQAYATYTPSTVVWQVRQYDQVGLAELNTYTGVAFPVSTPVSPAMCSDGNNYLFIADKDAAAGDTIKWGKYDASLTQIGPTTDTGYTASGTANCKVTGICIGTFDAGGVFGIAWQPASGQGYIDTFSVTGVRDANNQFQPSGLSAKGLTWGDALGDGARFWTLPPTGGAALNITKHSNWVWGSDSAKYWVGYTWYQTGLYESQISPRASVTLSRRQQLVITTPNIPTGSGANNVRVYIGRGASDPGANLALQATQTAITYTANNFVSDDVQLEDASGRLFMEDGLGGFLVEGSGLTPPTVNNFPLGTPAQIQSAQGSILLKGNGLWRLDQYRARFHQGSNTALTASPYKIPLDTKDFDPNVNVDTTLFRYVVPITGYYLILFGVTCNTAALDAVCGIRKNGGSIIRGTEAVSGAGDTCRSIGTDYELLTAGDYLELWMEFTSASSVAGSGFMAVSFQGTT